MTTCSSILAWEILWTEEPDRLQSLGSQDFPVPYKAWCLIRYVCELQGMVRKTKEGKGLPVEGKGSQWSADLSPNPMIPNTHLGSPFHAAVPAEHTFRDEGWKRRKGKGERCKKSVEGRTLKVENQGKKKV